jgi:exonuclease-1
MGISGLLPFLKPISRNVHLRDFQGETIGIDAYSWLHKAVFSCSFEIMTGKPTRKYIDYCVKKIKLLQHHKITPLLVFDGGNLPMKAGTEQDRKE